MITITLNKINQHNPCEDGWLKILEDRGGDDADYTEEFPLSDAFQSNDLDDVLWALMCLPEHNDLWRKYAVWCARQVQHLMEDKRSLKALDVAWAHSEGAASDDDLAAAQAAAWAAARDSAWDAARDAAHAAARDAAWAAAWDAAWAAAWDAARATAWGAAWAARDAQKAKLIEILNAGEWVEDEE